MPDYNMLFQAPNAGAAFANAFQQAQQQKQQNALMQQQMKERQEDRQFQMQQMEAKQQSAEVEQFQSTINAGATALQRLTSQGMPLDQAYQTVRQTLIANRFPGAEQIPPQADENYIKGIMSLAKPDAQDRSPSSVQEYEYAKQGGFSGSYMDFLSTKQGPIVANNGDGTFTLIPRSQQGGSPPASGAVPPPPPGFELDGGPTPPASGNFPG